MEAQEGEPDTAAAQDKAGKSWLPASPRTIPEDEGADTPTPDVRVADGSDGTAGAADEDDYTTSSGETAKEETVTPTLGPSWVIIAAPSALTTALDKADSVIDERGRAWCACGGHQGPHFQAVRGDRPHRAGGYGGPKRRRSERRD